MEFIKNYSDLNLFLNEFLNFPKSTIFYNNRIYNKRIFKAIMGIIALGRFSKNGVTSLFANRYFVDIIGKKTIMSAEDIFGFLKSIKIKSSNLDAYLDSFIKLNEINPDRTLSNKISKLSDKNKCYEIIKIFTKSNLDAGDIEELFTENNASKLLSVALLANHFFIKKNRITLNSKFNTRSKRFLDDKGYLILRGVLQPEEIRLYKRTLLKLADKERKMGQGFFYNDKKCQRVYNLINKDDYLASLVIHPLVIEIMDYLFDRPTLHNKYVLSSYHANIIGSGGSSGKLHVDAAVPQPLPPWIIRANFNFLLQDYTSKNGATEVVPGSHKMCSIPSLSYCNKKIKTKKLIAPAGSLIIWHGHLWHKSGPNKSKEKRTSLLGCFAASFLLEMAMEEDHKSIINKKRLNTLGSKFHRILALDHGKKAGHNI